MNARARDEIDCSAADGSKNEKKRVKFVSLSLYSSKSIPLNYSPWIWNGTLLINAKKSVASWDVDWFGAPTNNNNAYSDKWISLDSLFSLGGSEAFCCTPEISSTLINVRWYSSQFVVCYVYTICLCSVFQWQLSDDGNIWSFSIKHTTARTEYKNYF